VLLPADLGLWDIIQNLRPVPLAIIVILVLFSLFSWTIVFSKTGIFGRAGRANKNFLRAFRKANNLQAVAMASEQFSAAPLVAVFDFGYGEIERQMKQRGSLVNKPAVERSLQLGISEEVTKLEINMNWLATVASVSPFIGLFGTVWGIIDAFEGLGTAGSASLRAVAPGISEALVTTAIGLAAAIPAAIFYNIFGTRIKEMGTRMEDFAIEFQNFADRDFGG
jgi:biopolymer transport protein TolQ